MIEITRKQIEERYGYSEKIWILEKTKQPHSRRLVTILSDEQLYLIQDLVMVYCFSMSKINSLFGYTPPGSSMQRLLKRYDFNPTSKFVKTIQFIMKANKVHNHKYDYTCSEYVKDSETIAIRCLSHGIFYQKVNGHLSGNGCPQCGIITNSLNQTHTSDKFIDKAILVHGDRYDYDKVDYIDDSSNVTIVCRIHGDFVQKANNHLNGANCPNCANEIRILKLTDTKQDFVNKSRQKHGKKYLYSSSVYIDNNTRVEIICKIHGSFWLTPRRHKEGVGCPECTQPNIRHSKGHIWITDFCKSLNWEYQEEWSGNSQSKCINPSTRRPLFFDIYVPHLNLVIEFHHRQHYSCDNWFHQQVAKANNISIEEAYENYIARDEYKQQWALENGLQYLEIPYTLYDNSYPLETIFAPYLK